MTCGASRCVPPAHPQKATNVPGERQTDRLSDETNRGYVQLGAVVGGSVFSVRDIFFPSTVETKMKVLTSFVPRGSKAQRHRGDTVGVHDGKG